MTAPDPRGGAAETANRVLDGRVTIVQPVGGYRAAIDAVILAAAVAARPGARILDAGCGVGTAGLCLLARLPGLSVWGLELQPVFAACAARGRAGDAGLSVVAGDLARPPFPAQSFDHVLTNPPWLDPARHRLPPDASHALADAEGALPIAGWLAALERLLRRGGSLTMIHRADRLPDILRHWPESLGALVIRPIRPRAGADANRVLLAAIKGRRSPPRLLPDLVLHDEGGGWTAEADAILTGRSGPTIL